MPRRGRRTRRCRRCAGAGRGGGHEASRVASRGGSGRARGAAPPIRSATLPRLASRSENSRTAPFRRTESACGTRSVDDRPRDAHEDDDADPEEDVHLLVAGGRVARRTSAGWSPGLALAGGFAVSRNEAVACGARRSRCGRARSHAAAPRAASIRGLPCSVRAKPARVTVTTSGRAPGFRTVIDAVDAPFNSRRKGLTPSAASRDSTGRRCARDQSRHDDRRDSEEFHWAITVYVIVAV